MTSKYLSNRAINGLSRIGDILIPGDAQFPSFSDYQCLDHIDDLVTYAPKNDIKDLNMVLSILSYLPKSTLTWLIRKMSESNEKQGMIGSLLRQLNMGIRGIVFSLYYSEKPGHNYQGKNPTAMIGFTLNKVIQ
jgi:hypothetical protein